MILPNNRNIEVLIDEEDFERLSKYSWTIHYKHKPYVVTGVVNKETKKTKILYLHRMIMGFPEEKTIDHINGNALDNRKENLRICSNKENCRNSMIPKNNSTGYKGVSLKTDHKRVKPYRARINVDGKQILLGYFKTAEEAAEVYDKAALLYFKEFANINGVKK